MIETAHITQLYEKKERRRGILKAGHDGMRRESDQ
jgi:hypothetical protein